jgi:hypothetical protein
MKANAAQVYQESAFVMMTLFPALPLLLYASNATGLLAITPALPAGMSRQYQLTK